MAHPAAPSPVPEPRPASDVARGVAHVPDPTPPPARGVAPVPPQPESATRLTTPADTRRSLLADLARGPQLLQGPAREAWIANATKLLAKYAELGAWRPHPDDQTMRRVVRGATPDQVDAWIGHLTMGPARIAMRQITHDEGVATEITAHVPDPSVPSCLFPVTRIETALQGHTPSPISSPPTSPRPASHTRAWR